MIRISTARVFAYARRSGTLLTLLATAACAGSADAASETPVAAMSAPAAEEALMSAGMDQLYRGGRADSAVALFQLVRSANPTHYGARFQLARALDRAGRPVEARKLWEDVLSNANSISDSASAATASERLAKPDTVSQEAMMAIGLGALYGGAHADIAVSQFKQVLERNPTHYGAHYQLAVALDRAGKQDEARGWWEKTLVLAEGFKDQPTIETARARIVQQK